MITCELIFSPPTAYIPATFFAPARVACAAGEEVAYAKWAEVKRRQQTHCLQQYQWFRLATEPDRKAWRWQPGHMLV